MLSTKLGKILKVLGLAILGLTLGTGAMVFYSKSHHGPYRSLASLQPYTPSRLVLGKQAAAMTVEIVGPATYPDDSTEVVELVGFITQHIEGDRWLDYKWSLPRGVQVVQGQITGSLESAPLGQPQRITLLVSGFSSKRQKLITLGAQLEKAHTPLMASAVIVSRPEDTSENRVMRRQARAAESRRNRTK